MIKTTRPRLRQIVDWSAAVWAGLIAGSVLLILMILLIPPDYDGNGWMMIRYIASLVMGKGVLPPPMDFDPLTTIVALLVHFAVSLAAALVLAFITHRWGLITGILVGAAFGLGLYAINVYTLTYIFPWFFALNSLKFAILHVVFGALAGGIYEGIEVEMFEVIEE